MQRFYQLTSLATFFSALVTHNIYSDYTSTDTDTNVSIPKVTTSKPSKQENIILPSARPEVKEGVDLFITADLIVLQATESGLGFVVKDKNSFNSADVTSPSDSAGRITKGHVKNPNFEYQCGFKVGLGCNLSHDGWDAILSWLRYRDRAHNSASIQQGTETLFTTFISPKISSTSNMDGTALTDAARAHWKLRLDIADLEMGREFYTGKWLTLRPFFGLRSAWIKQSYGVDYDNVRYLFARSSKTFRYYDIDMHNNYWGFGPRIGCNGHWGFGSGLSLYGNLGVSVLYGYFHLNQEEVSFLSQHGQIEKSVRNSFHATKAITDLEIGLQWDYMFFNDSFHIGLHAGWQQQMFFSQNQLMRFTNGTEPGQFLQNQGDLGVQGWSIGFRFDF
jgi:hypothetical protein